MRILLLLRGRKLAPSFWEIVASTLRCSGNTMGKTYRPGSIPKPCRVRTRPTLLLAGFSMVYAAVACHPKDPPEAFSVPPRFWLESPNGRDGLPATVRRLRAAVAHRTVPFDPKCVEGGPAPDGLLLDSDENFLQFVEIDFLSSRAFLFEVYLIPDAAMASTLTPEALLDYPHVAVPHFPLPAATFREWLNAVVRGIRAAGARPF